MPDLFCDEHGPDDPCDALGCPYQAYDVECARCGAILSCVDAIVEEGDEWECEACNIRCDAIEYYEYNGLDILLEEDCYPIVVTSAIVRRLLR